MKPAAMAKGLWAVVPIKRLDTAKSRLASVLDPSQRADLAHAMMRDVFDVLAQLNELSGITLITNDVVAARLGRAYGARIEPDLSEQGMNAAVQQGLIMLHKEGQGGAIVVPGDIPFVTRHEMRRVIGALAATPVVIVPAARDGGTNILAITPPGLIGTSFGENSFTRHVAAARSLDMEPRVLRLRGAGHDIDIEDDLNLCKEGAARNTRAFLNSVHPIHSHPCMSQPNSSIPRFELHSRSDT